MPTKGALQGELCNLTAAAIRRVATDVTIITNGKPPNRYMFPKAVALVELVGEPPSNTLILDPVSRAGRCLSIALGSRPVRTKVRAEGVPTRSP